MRSRVVRGRRRQSCQRGSVQFQDPGIRVAGTEAGIEGPRFFVSAQNAPPERSGAVELTGQRDGGQQLPADPLPAGSFDDEQVAQPQAGYGQIGVVDLAIGCVPDRRIIQLRDQGPAHGPVAEEVAFDDGGRKYTVGQAFMPVQQVRHPRQRRRIVSSGRADGGAAHGAPITNIAARPGPGRCPGAGHPGSGPPVATAALRWGSA